MRIFAGGNLEGRKGVAIALRALARARDQGLLFRFLYGGHGPELRHLEQLTKELNLQEVVRFENMLPKPEYMEALHQSHIYLLPSLREGCPITLLEAMLAGCVPVVARCGGQAVAVTPECGILVEPTTPGGLEESICAALLRFQAKPDLWAPLSRAATMRVREGFSEAGYVAAMEKAYALAVKD